ncbi:MAG: hypothetical protein EBE86_004340 [Hormoscilla sp. GUM202]|nr:hypothetical protein [Hormoscilla sp. GUM202]
MDELCLDRMRSPAVEVGRSHRRRLLGGAIALISKKKSILYSILIYIED